MAEQVIDKLCHNGGMHLYDQYLQTKDVQHCSYRLMQFFEEGIQFSFFPGDPGEPEEEFDDQWMPEAEPVTSNCFIFVKEAVMIDHWATQIVKTKHVVKVDQNVDDGMSSSARSRRAPSIASSRKTFKMRKIQQPRKDSETRSRMGDSVRERSDRKENQGSVSLMLNTRIDPVKNDGLNLIPLEVEPPREITEEERQLRDRKDKQQKMKELVSIIHTRLCMQQEQKEQREKEERDRQRLKNKQDAFAEIEKGDYTYDDNGKIMIVKKPNVQRLPGNSNLQPEYSLNSMQQSIKEKVPIKKRLQSAKPQQAKELAVIKEQTRKDESIMQEVNITLIILQRAELELQQNYKKLFEQENESLRDYGLQKDMDLGAGIAMTDKEGRRLKGPGIDRTNKMSLQEYTKIASQFEVMNDERLSKYGSAKRLNSPTEQNGGQSQLDYIQEDEESYDMGDPRRSAERIKKRQGAEEVYDSEIPFTQHQINLRAKRKDLKSANVKTLSDKLQQKNRLSSAKQQHQDVRIRPQSKIGVKERIFNYENHIGGIDFSSDLPPNSSTHKRPPSGTNASQMGKKSVQGKQPAGSMNDEFNKKLVEKGTSYPILPSELPKMSSYLQKKQERPQTGKPLLMHQQKMGGEAGRQSQQELPSASVEGNFLQTRTLMQKKQPRERIISAKLPRDHDALPPPPFGKTMGHGFLSKPPIVLK